MVVKVKVVGKKLLVKNLWKFKGKMDKQLGQAAYASALVVQNQARKLIISGPKTGKIYTRGNITHQASAHPEAPASDTGSLAASIIATADKVHYTATVGSNLFYAEFLEEGTVRMLPRPFLQPSLEMSKSKIIRIFNAKLGKL